MSRQAKDAGEHLVARAAQAYAACAVFLLCRWNLCAHQTHGTPGDHGCLPYMADTLPPGQDLGHQEGKGCTRLTALRPASCGAPTLEPSPVCCPILS